LIVRKRLADGTLATAAPYVIKGVTWSPSSRTTITSKSDPNNVVVRRPEFGVWYRTDIPLLKAMNVNTVRLFMDPGLPADPNLTVSGLTILDELYRNGIMVIMTVDNGNDSVERIQPVVDEYRNHPAVLMWSLGSEWNLNGFFDKFPTPDEAAMAVEASAQRVKARDATHPVASSYGTIVNRPNDIEKYVDNVAPSIDVWSVNEYRGPGFGRLFDQWRFISGKPMFVGEFGIDAYDSLQGQEDPVTHAEWGGRLWDELLGNTSAGNPANVALGGTLFEWNDEWWKAGSPRAQDPGGWMPIAFPDGMASEDWWGVVTIDRIPRQLYSVLQQRFTNGYVPPPAPVAVTYRAMSHHPGTARFWENGTLFYEGQGFSVEGGRGFNIAAIDRTGRLLAPVQRFDTWLSRNTGDEMRKMIEFLDNVPDETLLLISVGDEAGLNFDNACTRLPYSWVTDAIGRLEALGSTQIGSYCFRDQWSLITIKGREVSLSEAIGHDAADAVTEATVSRLP
jgi:hypothetical protein